MQPVTMAHMVQCPSACAPEGVDAADEGVHPQVKLEAADQQRTRQVVLRDGGAAGRERRERRRHARAAGAALRQADAAALP